jgi:hypothetical protein
MSGQPGSVFRFNTVVFTGPTGAANMNCSGFDFTSNIVALNTTNAVNAQCMPHHTLFDLPPTTPGANNLTADSATFFVERGNDFHLAPNSPAKGIGEPGMVDFDFDGAARPADDPDLGAFEAL